MKKLIFLNLCLLLTYCSTNPQPLKDTSKNEKNEKVAEKRCFLMVYSYITDNEKQTEIFRDSSYLTYSVIENEISGVYKWLPAEKDQKVGTFKGTLLNDTADVVYSCFAEGEYATEELMFILVKGGVKIGQGENEFQGNLYKFKNKKEVKFIEFIPKVECSIIK